MGYMAKLPQIGDLQWGETLNEFLLASHNVDGSLKADAVVAAAPPHRHAPLPTSAWANGLPLFNVEDYGAVGDGHTDDYKAVAAAWNAMLASPVGGCVFFPRPVVYRVDAGIPGRLTRDDGGAYALFRLPTVGVRKRRISFGVTGVGSAYASPVDTGASVATSSVLFVDYSTAFGWSSAAGLPSVFGAADYDKRSQGDNGSYTNIHFLADGLTLRQPVNPSLCGMNLETCASVSIGSISFDVDAPLNDVTEPKHPTSVALLLPAHSAGRAAKVETLQVVGHYAAVPCGQYADITSAVALRCTVAVSLRRSASHTGHITSLIVAQCPWGFAGYDPVDGVTAVPDKCMVKVDSCDIEDSSSNGTADWTYAPNKGAHVYDPNNCLNGIIWGSRNDVDGDGHTDSLWVTGATHFSIFGLFGFTAAGSERIDASAHSTVNNAQ
jgi:hypothetical protein